ncbi:hypothetical protein RhiirA4_456644 [Rhizophagus irregularis]|uniref:Uncharacterized protein n=1 Tax=Rhizophagus irregularis TaxID=588596 RepID=A0A2I1G829_9GLOM|nr:hypothetical protein RhiirA4_456644 [Rhizophagus irregularis]
MWPDGECPLLWCCLPEELKYSVVWLPLKDDRNSGSRCLVRAWVTWPLSIAKCQVIQYILYITVIINGSF